VIAAAAAQHRCSGKFSLHGLDRPSSKQRCKGRQNVSPFECYTMNWYETRLMTTMAADYPAICQWCLSWPGPIISDTSAADLPCSMLS
jgi:hypothetical protein